MDSRLRSKRLLGAFKLELKYYGVWVVCFLRDASARKAIANKGGRLTYISLCVLRSAAYKGELIVAFIHKAAQYENKEGIRR